VLATLALGIGLTGTMFCLVRGATRQLPFDDAARLIHLERTIPSRDLPGVEVPIHDLVDWRADQRSFDDLAGFYLATADLAAPGSRPERYRAAFVSPGLFELLRVAPRLGRSFRRGEDAPEAEPVALLGEGVWRRRFGSDPTVVGRTVRIDGEAATVVGVMPEGFRFPLAEEVWLPLLEDPLRTPQGEGRLLEVVGRLRDGVSLEQARLDLETVAGRLASEHPETHRGVGLVLKPFVEEFVPRQVRLLLWTMLGAVFGVLLVACVNVANLLVAQTLARGKEIAVRAALGASRRRIASHLLAEHLLLAAGGLAGALGFIAVALTVFRAAIAGTDPPFWVQFRIDPAAVAFVAGVAALAEFISVWVPAWRAAARETGQALQQEGPGGPGPRTGRLVRVLVVHEIAVTLALLAAAGLMIHTIVNLRAIDYGFAPQQVLTSRLDLGSGGFPDAGARRRAFEALRRRVATLPGVSSAAFTSELPVAPGGAGPFAVQGRPPSRSGEPPLARLVVVSLNFSETFGQRLAAGRAFGPQDGENGMAVALVDETLARRAFPATNPLGQRLRPGDGRSNEPWRTIVGIVSDLPRPGADEAATGAIYLPVGQSDASGSHLVVRAAGDPRPLAAAVLRELRAAAPDLALGPVTTLEEVVRRGTWHYRVFGTLFLVFGGSALFLAMVGLAGVMSFTTSRRAHEIGVRRALGAGTPSICWMVLGQAALQLVAGLALGSVLALLLTRALRLILFGIDPWDASNLLAIAAILVAGCLAACALPIRRAVCVDPASALRRP
jgi:predicted permease